MFFCEEKKYFFLAIWPILKIEYHDY